MLLDYKKINKELYSATKNVKIINVKPLNYMAIRGNGNPNQENGLFQQAIQILYPVAYKLRMSYKTNYKIKNFEPYVVPPLEGLWWQKDIKGFDPNRKDLFEWILMIRLPDFIDKKDLDWAKETIKIQKNLDTNKIFFFNYNEGLSAQILHKGPFDEEIMIVDSMKDQLNKLGFEEEFNIDKLRLHHEIYLSDARKTSPEKLKKIIRHPIILK